VKVVGFGDNVVDRFLDRQMDYPGGNCVNFAAFATQLDSAAAYIGTFGSDELGAFLRAELILAGVDLSRSVIRSGESGIAQVEVVDGERIFRGGNHGGVTTREPVILGEDELDYISDFDLVHSSVYSSSESELPKLSARETLVSYDLSSEERFRTPSYLDEVAPHLDLALLSCSHISSDETESVLTDVVRRGAGMALGTRGQDGALLFDGSRFHHCAAVPLIPAAEIADTMGCGDAFVAAFALSLLHAGWSKHSAPSADSLSRALTAAAHFAARQCFVDGAFGHGRQYADSGMSEVITPVNWLVDPSPTT
jgi:fructoselysine 6-kinase